MIMAGLENESNFPADRATILRDIARNGSNDETDVHGSGDVGHNGQSNGLPNSCQDLDDPAALLESLANFEHPPSVNEAPPSKSTDHFASLLQAATTATEAEAAQTGHDQTGRQTEESIIADIFGPLIPSENPKRKRNHREDKPTKPANNKQRKKSRDGDEEQLARLREIWPQEESDDGVTVDSYEYESTPSVIANARAAGVHSAAALFRKPSSASKKYTRPPMSFVFSSLGVNPEQFLYLQAAAKNYMLDEDHPERRDCVGNKQRGDTDMTKLRLFGCVESFLEDEGWGEKCFGKGAGGADPRRLKWPSMKNKIVALITPLLRRIITNERQRHYASQSRKNRSEARAKEGNDGQNTEDSSAKPIGNQRSHDKSRSAVSACPFPEDDSKLDHYHYEVEEPLPPEDEQVMSRFQYSNRFISAFPNRPPGSNEVKYLVNITKDGQRIKPRFTLNPTTCPGFPSLVQHIQSIMDDGRATKSIQVLGPGGLIDVRDQSSWLATIEMVKGTEWMDGEVKCIVEMEEACR